MAQLPVDPLKYLGNLPFFNGNPNDLQNFCNLVDRVHPLLLTFNDTAQAMFIDIIRSKLTDKAKIIMDVNCEAVEWSRIKQILMNNFGDKKTCEELFNDMRSVVFKSNCLEFYNELMDKLRRLNNKTSIELRIYPELIEMPSNNRRVALRLFKNGLPEPMKSIVYCREPESIEDAMDILFDSGYAYYGRDYQRNGSQEHSSSNKNRNSRSENNSRNVQQPSRQQTNNGNNNSNGMRPQRFNSFNGNVTSSYQVGNNQRFNNSNGNNNNVLSGYQASNFQRSNDSNGNNRHSVQQSAPNNNPFRNNNSAPEPMEVGHLVTQSSEPVNFRSVASTENYHI